MFLKRLLAGTVVAASLAGLAFVAHTLVPEKDLGSDVFREQFAVTLVLPHGSASIRTVDYYPDMRTRKSALEDHADGTTTHYDYRPDGTLSGAVVFAKVDGSVKVRPVVRRSVMEADGVTYLADTEFDGSGRVTKEVALQEDGSTTRRYFHADGTLAKDQVMVRDGSRWKLMNELAFAADGSKSRVLAVTAGVAAIDTLYGSDEVVRAVRTTDLKFGKYNEVWFDSDGKTPIREVEQNSSRTQVLVKRKDGSISEKFIWYGDLKTGSLTAYVMDKHSNKRLEQTQYFIEGQLRMRSAEVYLPDGRRTDLVMFRTHGQESGTVEFTVHFEGKNFTEPHTRHEFRTDNTLESVKKQKDNQTTISEQKFTAQQNVKPDINPDWITVRKVELPPQVIPYVEQREH
ncbi:MAG: hypothetical protein SGJ27_05630 [Candidatus Melainabacteria bacterium]|nr:hypothetical protein [Candidatus Melainabacteria bacterium]